MKLKIAFLLGSLNRGGTETLLLDVFRNASIHHLNAIGIYRKAGVYEKDFCDSAVEMYKHSIGKNLISYILGLRKILKSNNVNIAHAQQPIDAMFAWIACLGSGIKVLLTFHGYDFSENKIGNCILRFIIKRTNINIFVSDTQRKYYQEKYKLNPYKQFVVYNGIDFKKLSNINTNNNIRTELNIQPTDILMGMVGNFVKVRDPLTVCKALVLLKNKGIAFQFVFVGKASDLHPNIYEDCNNIIFENNLSDQVHFLGSRNDVPNILQQLDAFVYSTDHDTFGIAVVEAMAAGIPVIVNNWPVMTEISQNGKYANIYETKNENDLLREMIQFIDNRIAYKQKAAEAAKYAKSTYSIEKHIANINALYANIIASKV